MALFKVPEDAYELVLFLERGRIDIFDALEYAPTLAADERGMLRLKINRCRKQNLEKKPVLEKRRTMSSKQKNEASAVIVGEAIGKISVTLFDAIRKLDGDNEEIKRMIRIVQGMIDSEKKYQESREKLEEAEAPIPV